MKAHSERVPNKNVRIFCGRPLYHHILDSLLNSEFINQVVINTDSDEIAEEAPRLFKHVRIIHRPIWLCGDFVSMNEVIAYDIEQTVGEYFLQSHCTNPLLTTATIDDAIVRYFSNLDKYDSLFSVTRFKTRLYWEDGRPINHDPSELMRTQDLPVVYEENSNMYIFSKKSFRQASNNRIGIKPQMFEINSLEAIDIDEEEDFKLAEAVYYMRGKR